jgi:hypothetical protein
MQAREGRIYPYPPSWVDRFTEWVEKLPGRSWVFYPALALALAFVSTIVDWGIGLYPIGTFNAFHIWLPLHFPYLIALIRYLDGAAEEALRNFRPALDLSEEEYAELRYRLTTAPARPMLLGTLAGFAWNIILGLVSPDAHTMMGYSTELASFVISFLFGFIMWGATFVFIYHTIHQLRLVSNIYAEHAKVNLFDLSPLYAFSSLSSKTAIGFLIMISMWLVTGPKVLFQSGGFVIDIIFSIVTIVTFMWPLLGIHGRLVQEKQRLLRESSQRQEATIAELHGLVDTGESKNIDELNARAQFLHVTMACLEIEQSKLTRVPTWPWQPATLRGFVSALLLPLVVFVLQYLLQRFLA